MRTDGKTEILQGEMKRLGVSGLASNEKFLCQLPRDAPEITEMQKYAASYL